MTETVAWDQFGKLLVANGAMGVLTLGLAFAVKLLWRQNQQLREEKDRLQDKRIEERDTIVKALAESSRMLAEVAEIVPRRRL